MTPERALEIVTKLAEGVDPYTGERLPAESVYQHPDTVRALYAALDGLEKLKRATERQKSLPTGAGRAWTAEDEKTLVEKFDATKDVPAIAKEFNRTPGAIWSRLVKLGKVSPLDRPREGRPVPSSRILTPRQQFDPEPPY